MKMTELMDEAVSLPLEERARLADVLLQSLNPPDVEHLRAWTGVARRRIKELRDGAVQPVSGDEVFERLPNGMRSGLPGLAWTSCWRSDRRSREPLPRREPGPRSMRGSDEHSYIGFPTPSCTRRTLGSFMCSL